MKFFRITNMHGTIIWEGECGSFYDAWQKMFDACEYPFNKRIISNEINNGLWIEKL